MSSTDALHGLACPRCGGVISIPEGQSIVICPYCGLRSVVSGERGVRRYQVPCKIDREQAEQALHRFLSGNLAIALDVRRKATVREVFLAHLPFWAGWGRVLGWVFGEKKERRRDSTVYEPREIKVVQEMNWNQAACEVGEFGVNRIRLEGRTLDPFQPDVLHRSGLVFEPVGSGEEALVSAEKAFEDQVRQKSGLDRISQANVRIVRPLLGVVYYPLWVVRYLYRGRSFQVAVDGFNGDVLYGKAPGNSLYRAAVLIGGMAFGAFLTIDMSALLFSITQRSHDLFWLGLGSLGLGVGMMIAAYRRFRYGEHYEYQRDRSADTGSVSLGSLSEGIKSITKLIDELN